MTETHTSQSPSRALVVAAFACVYLIWGSTYLAIRYAIETIPPFFMAGVRFIVAGVLMYVWLRWRGAPKPQRIHWKGAAIVGALLLLVGNGGVSWAEQRVPSGLAALLIGSTPMWMVLLDWLWHGNRRPRAGVGIGLLLGFIGVGLLVSPGQFVGSRGIDPLGAAVLLIAALSWATGSLWSRRLELPSSSLQSTAMQMLLGGVFLLGFGAVVGETGRLDVGGVSLRSIVALIYLTSFGSIIAFSAYIWILRSTTAARASTYAYVNPVVAVFLGWAVAGEELTLRTLLAAAAIVTAVVLIIGYSKQSQTRTPEDSAEPSGQHTETVS